MMKAKISLMSRFLGLGTVLLSVEMADPLLNNRVMFIAKTYIPSAQWQATRCPPPTSFSLGVSLAQIVAMLGHLG